jgi:hypothetical protein
MKRLMIFACAVLLSSQIVAFAVDVYLNPYIQVGSGQAEGSLFSGIGSRYAELGASSIAKLGSSAPWYPMVLGGIGIDLSLSRGPFFLWNGPLSFVVGLDADAWGGALSGTTASGLAFASTRARNIAVSVRVAERIRFPLGRGLLSLELGPFAAANFGYLIRESISGVTSTTWLSPTLVDLGFVGAGIGIDYGLRLGPGILELGLRGDLALTPTSSLEGALGAEMVYPWRVLVRAGYELPIGAKRVRK